MRFSRFLAVAPALALFAFVRTASAACASPSPTHVCVTHDGVTFKVDTGSGYVSQGQVPATANVQITFEIDSACGSCSFHPFYVSTSSTGGGLGALTSGITSGSQNFTPTQKQIDDGLYYQCQIHASMGGPIGNALIVDAGSGDAASIDSGSSDAGATDASTPDSSTKTDASTTDASTDDASSTPDASGADAAKNDAGIKPQTDDGGCSMAPAGGERRPIALALLAMAALVLHRRRARR